MKHISSKNKKKCSLSLQTNASNSFQNAKQNSINLEQIKIQKLRFIFSKVTMGIDKRSRKEKQLVSLLKKV